MRGVIERILTQADPGGDPGEALVAADWCLRRGDRATAASMLDRAHGLDPGDAQLAARRVSLLDTLAITEHGLCWRYVPAGAFLMGSAHGEADERPVHRVELDAFWIMDTPITWAAYTTLLGWRSPTEPAEALDRDDEQLPEHLRQIWYVAKMWRQYSELKEDEPAPAPSPAGARAGAHPRYDAKPLVAVGPVHAEHLAERMTQGGTSFELPSEARWEKAARGGRIGARYAWGDEPPTPRRCDFDHFGDFHLVPTRSLPPNGYGLYGCCGGVWEWTSSEYDALAYHSGRSAPNPEGARVLRGGSFTDPAPAVTVSYRMSRAPERYDSPNLGFRLCRLAV
ncbi:MAG TPA: Sulphatase-modifying factor protein [Deltaproteobacteria bacterium]|nr:Sulphatase-modifying factor protein [Deltaproteobacteria bacterium]